MRYILCLKRFKLTGCAVYKLCFFVPVENVEKVRLACFNAGAGKLGDYDCCAWQVLGQGQFRPLAGSQPHMGQQDRLEAVAEYKVEMVCADDVIGAAVEALKAAHPYETPAYEVFRLEDF